MAEPKVGLQLIVFMGRQNEDLAGVVKDVAEAGYAGIEAGNQFKMRPADEVKRIYEETGLAVAGMHSGYGDAEDMAAVDENIEFLKTMDSKYLICSGVAQGEGIERFEKAAETFNKVGEHCKQAGITFCYHNHAWEFEDLGGVKGIHRLCELTDPALVKLCIDVYWVHIGGEDPAEFIRRHADRAGYYHFKDGAPADEPGGRPSFVELGRGVVDLSSAKDAALAAGADWITCEQDRTELDPSESIRISRAYIRETLGL